MFFISKVYNIYLPEKLDESISALDLVHLVPGWPGFPVHLQRDDELGGVDGVHPDPHTQPDTATAGQLSIIKISRNKRQYPLFCVSLLYVL